MAEIVIETRSLSYRYGQQQILDALSLSVPKGSIYGFLGPNGAGKTTTIKILLSLLHSAQKNVFLFGKEITANRIEILTRIGSLVEQPAVYAHLTGRENLLNRALLLRVNPKRAEDMLALTGLSDAANKKAGQYSLGMKQRLGIGLALLSDPELLILDEPTNGLDPNGIIEIRHLLRKLTREEGKTIFVSSHLLSEVEKMATHVGIINRGKLMFQGSIEQLHHLNQSIVSISVDNLTGAADILLKKGFVPDIHQENLILPYASQTEMGNINTLLVQSGITVYSICNTQKDLEHAFLNITQN